MNQRPTPENDFFPSTLEHRPLFDSEKKRLKAYFELDGKDEHEGFVPSGYANSVDLQDLEAWIWGMRFWGRDCLVNASAAAVKMLADEWEAQLAAGKSDEVHYKSLSDAVRTPALAAAQALKWSKMPTEVIVNRLFEELKPMPEEWLEEPAHSKMQESVFFWGVFAGHLLHLSILEKRDQAAKCNALTCTAAANGLMLSGKSAAEAVELVRAKIVLSLREWMGYKW